MANPLAAGIVPAQLGFLAIYNPSLGTTDETIEDQIVYYASASTRSSAKRRRRCAANDGRPTDILSNEERNERLRQIGLAQGMVEFGRSFSGGKAVDSIDTERTRVVLHELEPGWWILASIDLTRLPLPPTKTTSSTPPPPGTKTNTPPPPKYEYSSREVKPPALLLQDLLRAHALFLLHHGPSLSALLNSTPIAPSSTVPDAAAPDAATNPDATTTTDATINPDATTTTTTTTTPTPPAANTSRPHFTALLTHYWDLFLSTWNVLLHGNPASAVFAGIKIAACGELGMGVGEEDRGSGEREVLEGLVGGREGGLVDLVVGRFGVEGKGKGGGGGNDDEGWFGVGNEVGADDGVVFLGAGVLSRPSLRAVAGWMEDVYTWGESAYGVVDGAAAGGALRTKRRRAASRRAGIAKAAPTGDGKKVQAKGKPKPSAPEASGAPGVQDGAAQPGPAVEDALAEAGDASGGMDKMFSYLKLGYGTYWSLGTASPATNSDADDEATPNPDNAESAATQKPTRDPDAGFFMVGLGKQDAESEQPDSPEQTKRTSPPTVTAELDPDGRQGGELGVVGPLSIDSNNRPPKKTNITQLRPAIYVHRPFIYILLFQPNTTTPSSWDDLSQSLHSQLTHLHKPLLASTTYRPEKPNLGIPPTTSQSQSAEIYDLVFDPSTLAIHSTIPNIPSPRLLTDPSGTGTGSILAPPPSSPAAPWTRVEALNTHSQILSLHASSRGDPAALERTCKTSRGWWVVWNRVLAQQQQRQSLVDGGEGSDDDDDDDDDTGGDEGEGGAELGDDENTGATAVGKEIFLVRRASDHGGVGGVRGVSASYVGGASGGWTDGASRLAQGIGVDTRRYIEGLLSLNR